MSLDIELRISSSQVTVPLRGEYILGYVRFQRSLRPPHG